MSDASPVIEVLHVSKAYASQAALDDISFTIARGECFALLGPNGAGKTTLMRILTSILEADSGKVSILGTQKIAEVRDRMGYLPEERGLYKRQKVIDILSYLGQLKGLAGKASRDAAMNALNAVQMAQHAQSKPETLSKGMAQRIQLAATLVHDPEIAIFDEPFSGLDPASSRDMQDLLLAEKARGRTLILSTHQMQPVERLCDRLLMLNKGRAVLYGSIGEVRERYRTGVVRVRHDGPLPQLAGVAIEAVSLDESWLTPAEGMSAQALVALLIAAGAPVTGFEVETPSLEEIFIREVRGL